MSKRDHTEPFRNPRNPRPKGAQRGTGDGTAPAGCLMAILALPVLVAKGLLRRV